MKILHLISQPPDFTGSGKFIQKIISHAGQKGHDNYLLAGVQGDFAMDPALVPEEKCTLVRFDSRDLGFPVAGMSDAMPYKSTVFSQMSREMLAAYHRVFRDRLREALDRFSPDLLHSHHLWILSSLARTLAPNLPMVTTCHGTCLRQHGFCDHISPKICPALSTIDRVMALNLTQQKEIMERFGFPASRVPVMAGGYDETVFRPGEKPNTGRVDMVYAGKLSRAKGVDWLLKSLDRIRDLPFCLHMAGGGSGGEKEACLDLARNLGDKVVYHGTLSHEDLAALMGRAHLFILPSFFEGVPLVLMEALACGCRILSTDLPGVREILAPADNDLIHLLPLPPLATLDRPHEKDEPGLETLLADRLKALIRRILEDPVPDRGLAVQKTAPHTWAQVVDRIHQVYGAAMADHGKILN